LTLQQSNQPLIRFGVLGAARVVPYGLLTPANETQGVEVSGIASRTRQKADEFAARHGIERSFGSYEALLEAEDIDAVYIALPTGLHYEWTRRAIEAGKHVLCEKPLAENAQRAQELTLFAQDHGRTLVEAMHLRYLERVRRQHELVAGGEFGRVLYVDSCFRSSSTPMAKDDFRMRFELGGGAALDVGCYAVSCLRYIAGEEPEILSVRHKRSRPQIDRWMRAQVRFPSGAKGLAEFGFRGLYRSRGDIAVTCEKGWIKWDATGLVHQTNGNVTREVLPTKSTYRLQLDAFAKAVRGEPSDVPPPDDAVLTARVLDALYEKAGLAPRGPRHSS
jgi:predicted dehydrogenase